MPTFRLHVQTPENIVEAARTSFVMPTPIEDWIEYLRGIRSNFKPRNQIPDRLRRNIGHRLQLLEFETSLILNHREVNSRTRQSTLHQTVLRMKIHQCCVTAHTILEGLGSHLVRMKTEHFDGTPADPSIKIATPTWRAELIEQVGGNRDTKKENRAKIKAITDWRDKVHFDTFNADDHLQFNQFDFQNCYVPTYITFRMMLSGLNAEWPQDCCLNEEIQNEVAPD